jgi:hypothetical protein
MTFNENASINAEIGNSANSQKAYGFARRQPLALPQCSILCEINVRHDEKPPRLFPPARHWRA